MKNASGFCSIAAVIALVVSAPIHAAPPIKPPPSIAYVHTVVTGTGGNVCAADGSSTVLDNTLANGNPNAVIVVTHNVGNTNDQSGLISTPGVLTVYYDGAGVCGTGTSTTNHWIVNNENAAASNLLGGEKFNIIVTAP